MKRVLVTGPLEGLSEYADAARRAGWEAIEQPLLRIVRHRHDVSPIFAQRFDWICVTSSNALWFLDELCRARSGFGTTPCAIVGERSSARARELGLEVELTAENASALGDELARVARSGAHVLWPRGHLTDELARELRRRGFVVTDPVVYATEPLDPHHRPPPAEAILFASPSSVRAWHANVSTWNENERSSRASAGHDRATEGHHRPSTAHEEACTPRDSRATPRIAIAIGRTTLDALMSETDIVFFDTISLPEPTPEAFGFTLQHLDLGRDEPTS
jgi:uroporphyrinogen-III synthase